jgi:hypothetical protein
MHTTTRRWISVLSSLRGQFRRRRARARGCCAVPMLALALAGCDASRAGPSAALGSQGPLPGVVSLVSVTSDRIEDVSSLEAWQRSFIRSGMSDADKAQAVWTSVVKFRQQDEPARELLEASLHPHDPIRLFNVYGYSQCDCASAAVEALSRAAGLSARGWALRGHSVPEVEWSGAWHMLDGAYITQFPGADGQPVGADAINAAIDAWLPLHPGLGDDRAALLAFMAGGGWRNGPPLIAASPYLSPQGLYPAQVQGWADTIYEFAPPPVPFEYDYTLGYRVNLQLREGERLTRNWSNVGHHINDDLGLSCESVDAVPGQGDLGYSPAWGDIAPGRVGNGRIEYDLPLVSGRFTDGALELDNLAARAAGVSGPKVAVVDGTRPGTLVVRMPSSYVYLGGSVTLQAQLAPGGTLVVSVSRNNGLDWIKVASSSASGQQTIDLTPFMRRLSDYRLRLQLDGAGSGLDAVTVTEEIQHSQRALPALAQGDNHIRFSAGPDEGTITVEGNTDASQSGNLTYSDFHPDASGLVGAPLQVGGDSGQLTFPVDTPGDLTRLRFGVFYRARASGDSWDELVSFDGSTFLPAGHAAGPTTGDGAFVTFDAVPPGVRHALVRFVGHRTDTAEIFDFRIDADYHEPHGGFRPVQVTYRWQEGGQPREDVHVATSPSESYTIHCDGVPRMSSLTLELAPTASP